MAHDAAANPAAAPARKPRSLPGRAAAGGASSPTGSVLYLLSPHLAQK